MKSNKEINAKIPDFAKKRIWFKLSDIPDANYVSLFAYNLVNPIRDYPKIGIGDYIKEGFVEWNKGIASYHLKRDQFNKCADMLADFIINMTDDHKKRVSKYYALAKRLMEESEKFKNLDFSKMSDQQSIDEFNKLAELHRQNHLYGGILTFLPDEEQQRVSNAILNKIKDLIEKNKSNLDLTEAWNVLTTPSKRSFREQEEIDILRIAKKLLQNEKIDINNELIVKHHAKYCWLPYMYSGPAYNIKYYYTRIKKKIKSGTVYIDNELGKLEEKHKTVLEEQQKILSQLKPNPKDKQLLEFAQEMVFIKGYRKDTFYHLFYCYELFFREVAKRIHIELDLVRFLFPWEFKDALINKKFSQERLQKRKNKSLYYMDKEKIVFYFDQEVENFKQTVKIEGELDKKKSMKGMIAYPGYAKGTVRIVNRLEDMKKMNYGEILISQMTSPNIVPAMKKAAAIVTNTGGLTCHASILSRELKIPCIIGTKIATKVLKDGMEVEVDAEKGIVKIIKN